MFAFDQGDWIIPGAITAKDHNMYRDCGGYDWLLCEKIRPLEYHAVKPITSGLKVSFEPIIMGFAHTRAPASKETGAVKSESDQGS